MLNTRVISRINKLSCLLIFMYLIIVSYSLGALNWGDDQTFLDLANQDGFNILHWLYSRYFEWSGRVTIEFLMLNTISFPLFWKVFIPLAMLLLAYSISKIVFNRVTSVAILFVLFLMSIAPVEIISESLYWVTGFYNYLLPLSLGVYCFSVFYDNQPRFCSVLFAFCSVFLFSYQEQIVVLFLLACFFVPEFYKDKIKIGIMALVLVNGAILFLAPGNENRLEISYWGSYPQYMDFGLLHKVALGFDKLYQAFIFSDNWPLFIFMAVLCSHYFFINEVTFPEKVALFLLISFMGFFLAHMQEYPFSSRSLAEAQYEGMVHPSATIGGKMFVWYFIFLLVMVSTLTLLLKQIGRFGEHAIFVLALGVASVLMMGFSPTVYTSTYRVQLIFEIAVIFALLYMLKSLWLFSLRGLLKR